ncbi:iron-siderophore ABC transporter substrate-binding protein [Providencia sneebia]|uniref:Ferrichrome-binding protein n=1 Tax=Providencia sneebia DSM 19967 TaxID=1141660 RepID=K8W6L2_9GAMM|nr:iron-siderophore ABC transporter substrate-binding protein [Providencia sneebia]EKT56258.1 ferrichrome-binding protein [Providencia sneebia DSM 19967]
MRLISFRQLKYYFISALLMITSNVAGAITITDSFGEQHFSKPPERVVVLDWDLLEQLLTLNITPVGATELSSYQQWVVEPPIPAIVEDVGTRAEPNLEKIAALHPDVIIASRSQEDLLPLLKTIAPVVYLPNFGVQDNAGNVAIDHFRTLAQLFDRNELADAFLDNMFQQFAKLRATIENQFPLPPAVAAIRFSSLNTVFLYTENSTLNYVLEQLALKPAISIPARPWGIEQQRINSLQFIDNGYVLYIKPFANENELADSILWQSMPFVKQGHVNSVRPVWNYGGVYSLQLMAEALTESLLQVTKHDHH